MNGFRSRFLHKYIHLWDENGKFQPKRIILQSYEHEKRIIIMEVSMLYFNDNLGGGGQTEAQHCIVFQW